MNDDCLTFRRDFKHPRERVFEAFTSPDSLKQWHCGSVRECVMEPRAGGLFLIRFAPDENMPQSREIRGIYRVFEPPERLIYTWRWDGEAEESLVTVTFSQQAQGTRLELRHERLAGSESREGHRMGWEACLQGLDEMLQREANSTPASMAKEEFL